MSSRARMMLLASLGAVGACASSSSPSALESVLHCGDAAADEAMMKALAPTCSGCHTMGAKPFFASTKSFTDLLADNPAYVTPGHPEQSYLVDLLQGRGKGTYKQMPLAGESFAQLASEGKTQVSLQEVEDWIAARKPRPQDSNPDLSAATVQRLSAEQVRATLFAQLGLTLDDFFTYAPNSTFGTATEVSISEDNYPVYGADEGPGCFSETSNVRPPVSRHASLGGAQTSQVKQRDLTPSPSFVLSLAAMSQAWCKMAIAKPTNPLFPAVSPDASSATAADAIKKNIAYLSLHFLGDPATNAEVDDIFENVFVAVEAGSDPRTAWAGVCSYFIRHPKWIFD